MCSLDCAHVGGSLGGLGHPGQTVETGFAVFCETGAHQHAQGEGGDNEQHEHDRKHDKKHLVALNVRLHHELGSVGCGVADGVIRVDEASWGWGLAVGVLGVSGAVLWASSFQRVQVAVTGLAVGVFGVGTTEARASTGSAVNFTDVDNTFDFVGVGRAEIGAAFSCRFSSAEISRVNRHVHESDVQVGDMIASARDKVLLEVEGSGAARVFPLAGSCDNIVSLEDTALEGALFEVSLGLALQVVVEEKDVGALNLKTCEVNLRGLDEAEAFRVNSLNLDERHVIFSEREVTALLGDESRENLVEGNLEADIGGIGVSDKVFFDHFKSGHVGASGSIFSEHELVIFNGAVGLELETEELEVSFLLGPEVAVLALALIVQHNLVNVDSLLQEVAVLLQESFLLVDASALLKVTAEEELADTNVNNANQVVRQVEHQAKVVLAVLPDLVGCLVGLNVVEAINDQLSKLQVQCGVELVGTTDGIQQQNNRVQTLNCSDFRLHLNGRVGDDLDSTSSGDNLNIEGDSLSDVDISGHVTLTAHVLDSLSVVVRNDSSQALVLPDEGRLTEGHVDLLLPGQRSLRDVDGTSNLSCLTSSVSQDELDEVHGGQLSLESPDIISRVDLVSGKTDVVEVVSVIGVISFERVVLSLKIDSQGVEFTFP